MVVFGNLLCVPSPRFGREFRVQRYREDSCGCGQLPGPVERHNRPRLGFAELFDKCANCAECRKDLAIGKVARFQQKFAGAGSTWPCGYGDRAGLT